MKEVNILIKERIMEHFHDGYEHFNFHPSQIIGIFLCGSQNYGVDTPFSDVDTKLIVTPTFEDIAINKTPICTTYVRQNQEHINIVDIRLLLHQMRKQNINNLEILFTNYKIETELYKKQWSLLVEAREEIARYSPYNAVLCMKGIVLNTYHLTFHETVSKSEVFEKFGYNPKCLMNLFRMQEYVSKYIEGKSYELCLRPAQPSFLLRCKSGEYNKKEAEQLAKDICTNTVAMIDEFCIKTKQQSVNEEVECLLNNVQREIVRIGLYQSM